MSRNAVTRDRDGNWGAIHDRLSEADARRRAELDAEIHRGPPPCRHCGEETQAGPGTRGYCWRPLCQAERRRVEYARARAAGRTSQEARQVSR